jgi:hypothetical protein
MSDNLVRLILTAMIFIFILLVGLIVAAFGQTPVEPAPIIDYATANIKDTEPPVVTVKASAWAWPVCEEDGVTVELTGAKKGSYWRRATWIFTDRGLNQTIVTRTEVTVVSHLRHADATETP